jgi:hypothetical protein
MTTVPSLVVAGDPDIAQKLQSTGHFRAVFHVTSATELRALSRSGKVRPPATFMFAADFEEDLPDVTVRVLANGLAGDGFIVVVHNFFTESGDVFDPRVVVHTRPMTLSDLLAVLGAAAQPVTHAELLPEPPPEAWAAQEGAESSRAGHDEEQGHQETPETVPGYGKLSIIHQGTGAITYRAVHEESGTEVALRVRHDRTEAAPDELAALARASQDEHVVTVLESGRTPAGHWYTASVYCHGGAFTTGSPLPIQDAVGVAVMAGKGLQALHDEGLVHGDVHPGRLMHGPGGPLLTGAATLRGLAAHSGLGLLEPVDPARIDGGFAAPEVLSGQALTASADVFGLGVTLWSLLTGRAPHSDEDRAILQEGDLHEALPWVPRDAFPQWLADALARATANEPADRYPTVRAFTDALEEGLAGGTEPQAAPQPGPHAAPQPEPWAVQEASEEPIAGFILEEAPEPHPQDSVDGWELDEMLAGHPSDHAQHQDPLAVPGKADPGATPGYVDASSTQGQKPPSRRVPVLLVLAMVAVVVLVIGAAAAVGIGSDGDEQRTQAKGVPASAYPDPLSPVRKPSRSAPSSRPMSVKQSKMYMPRQVRLADARVSITVTWKDVSGGRAAHYVVGGPVGRDPSTLASVPPGTALARVTALNPSVDYCLTVVAVVDVDRVAHAEPVCTHRVKRTG